MFGRKQYNHRMKKIINGCDTEKGTLISFSAAFLFRLFLNQLSLRKQQLLNEDYNFERLEADEAFNVILL